jgi:hypothetical protein
MKLARQNRQKHHFSVAHTNDIENAILCSRRVPEWIRDYEAGKKTLEDELPNIYLFGDTSYKSYTICTSCKYMGRKADRPHKCTAEARAATVAYYKMILADEVKVRRVAQLGSVSKSSKEVQTEPMEAATASQEEVARLQKKIERQKKEIEGMEEDAERSNDLKDALLVALTSLAEETKEGEEPGCRRVLLGVLANMKKYSPETFGVMKKELGELWYDSIMHKVEDEDEE